MKSVLEMAHGAADSRAHDLRIQRRLRRAIIPKRVNDDSDSEVSQFITELRITTDDIIQQLGVGHILGDGQRIEGFPQRVRASAESLTHRYSLKRESFAAARVSRL